MFIAVRLEPNGLIYIVKNLYTNTEDDEQYSLPPYNYTKVEIDDKYADCINQDFNEDLTFSVEKYNARKQRKNEVNYETLVVNKIRQRYSINQELAILRQRDIKPEEYQEYFNYVEQCKEEAKNEYLRN